MGTPPVEFGIAREGTGCENNIFGKPKRKRETPKMKSNRQIWFTVAAAAVAAGGYLLYRHTAASQRLPAVELVEAAPADASAVVYLDLAALRGSPLLTKLRALAPHVQADAEYAEFVRETGFDYERDLDRVVIATMRRGGAPVFFAAAVGRFDTKKITAQALKSGRREVMNGREVFTVPVSGSARQIQFAFMAKDRIVLTDGGDWDAVFSAKRNDAGQEDLRERATRLAGSPVFAVLHPEPGTLSALAARVPGGVRSEQLAALAANLRWITVAARPNGEQTRIVIEGESASEDAARQLAGLLENLLVIARLVLDDAKGRERLNPAEREALVEMLKGAEVTRVDRGDTKAVRLILPMGPRLFDAILNAEPPAAAAPAASPSPSEHRR